MKECDRKIESIAKEYLSEIDAKEPEKEWLRSFKKKA
jgi:hypothetical protein